MKSTGIVRRIDELGRIVIPKELRKTLRIKDGDPLEIYANKDELVLRKYSPVLTVGVYAQAIADGIQGVTEKTCLITDGDAVIYVSDGKYKEMTGQALSEDMDRILRERKCVILNKSDGANIISIVKGNEVEVENQIIVPMISEGDCYGSIILLDKDKTSRFSSGDVKLLQLGSSFLTAQFA